MKKKDYRTLLAMVCEKFEILKWEVKNRNNRIKEIFELLEGRTEELVKASGIIKAGKEENARLKNRIEELEREIEGERTHTVEV